MEDKDLWTTFEKTGSVVDYLNYKGIHADYAGKHANSHENCAGSNVDFRRNYPGTGEGKFESVDNSDRDDTVRNTYR